VAHTTRGWVKNDYENAAIERGNGWTDSLHCDPDINGIWGSWNTIHS